LAFEISKFIWNAASHFELISKPQYNPGTLVNTVLKTPAIDFYATVKNSPPKEFVRVRSSHFDNEKNWFFLFRIFNAIMIEDNFLCLVAFSKFWGKLRQPVWGYLNARLGDVFSSDPLWRIWLKFCTASTQVILRGGF